MKYWLSDLAVSLQSESEENAEEFGEQLDKSLQELANFDPAAAKKIQAQVEAVKQISIDAVDAYSDDNRVLGNSLLAKARDSIRVVDVSLTRDF